MKLFFVALAATTTVAGAGTLRGQSQKISSNTIPTLSTSEITSRLTTANAAIDKLEKMTKTTTTPALVEVGVKRAGQGTPTAVASHAPMYHSVKTEEASLKQVPLPPPRFASVGAKVVPSFAGSTNPYSQGSVYGRGFQDGMTPTTGTFANNYGPASGGPMGTQGYGSFPQQIDPRGFGGTYNFSTPYSSFFGDFKGKGISSEGFKYQVPYSNVHPMAPYSGNPFTAGYGPGGPYFQQQGTMPGGSESASAGAPMLQNYTQFGPHPFGPYGTMSPPGQGGGSSFGGMPGQGRQNAGLIPSSYPLGHGSTPGGPMGPAGAMGMGSMLGPAGMGMGMGMGGAMLPGMMGPGMMGGGMAYGPGMGPGMPMGMGGGAGMGMGAGMMNAGAMMGGQAQSQYNPAFGMGMIPHMNNGNMYDPAFPAGNLGGNPRSASQSMQHAWAMGMPGISPTMNPTMAMHHGLNLPGGMGQFKDPPMAHGYGEGCKSCTVACVARCVCIGISRLFGVLFPSSFSLLLCRSSS